METENFLPLWQKNMDSPFLPALSSHQTADVCVIGGGIAGLTVAYELLREGRSVIVLERHQLSDGETGHTTAHLSNALDTSYAKIQKLHGNEASYLAAQSHTAAIDEIEEIVTREGIECEFTRLDGYLFLSAEKGVDTLQKELEASHLAGLAEVEWIDSHPHFSLGPCLRYPRQAQLHPIKYAVGLANAVKRMGGKIFQHTEAQEIEGGKPGRVTTNRGFQIVCGSIVVATNSPINDRVTMHTKMAPYRTYVVGMRLPGNTNLPALYWDTADPYHYIRFATNPSGNDLILLVGGEDHRTGQEMEKEDRYAQLTAWTKDHFAVEGPPVFYWSGQVLEPHDGLGYIGRNPADEENVFIVTGHGGHGFTYATIAGMLLRDLILNRSTPWSNLYNPSRVNLRSLNTYLKETFHSTTPYGDWLSPGDVVSLKDIPTGEGAIIREGLHKIAAYKDSFGRVHMCSAVCPHLNGIVRWNTMEKTWDCPCHGSRFDRLGKVLNGPAATGLREIVDPSVRERRIA